MKLFPIKHYEFTLNNENDDTWINLKNNTRITKNHFSFPVTGKRFVGQVIPKVFRIRIDYLQFYKEKLLFPHGNKTSIGFNSGISPIIKGRYDKIKETGTMSIEYSFLLKTLFFAVTISLLFSIINSFILRDFMEILILIILYIFGIITARVIMEFRIERSLKELIKTLNIVKLIEIESNNRIVLHEKN